MIISDDQWVIEAQKFCGLSITHRWHRLRIDVIDYSSVTHRLLIDYYTAHERHFSCFLVPYFSFLIFLSVLDAFFLVSEDPVDDVETQCANHKYSFFNFVFLRQIRLQPRDDINEYWMKSMTKQCNQWLIDDQKFCGLSISHRLLIDHRQ